MLVKGAPAALVLKIGITNSSYYSTIMHSLVITLLKNSNIFLDYFLCLHIMMDMFISKHYLKTFISCSVHKSVHKTIDNCGLIKYTVAYLTVEASFTDRVNLNHHRDKGMDI